MRIYLRLSFSTYYIPVAANIFLRFMYLRAHHLFPVIRTSKFNKLFSLELFELRFLLPTLLLVCL